MEKENQMSLDESSILIVESRNIRSYNLVTLIFIRNSKNQHIHYRFNTISLFYHADIFSFIFIPLLSLLLNLLIIICMLICV